MSGDSENLVENKDNLIVNYLPRTMTEDYLRILFDPFGVIASIKIVRDKHTRESCGYGFVRFENAIDAGKALKALNGYNIEKKRLKVSYAKPVSVVPSETCDLYVSGLPITYAKEDLHELFQEYGDISDTSILYNEEGESKGVGFVKFTSFEDASKAVEELHDTVPADSTSRIVVKFSESKKRSQDTQLSSRKRTRNEIAEPMMYPTPYPVQYNVGLPPDPRLMQAYPQPMPYQVPYQISPSIPQQFCLFIFHVPPTASEESMTRLFEQFATVLSVKIPRDSLSQASKGFAFVNVESHEQGEACISALNGYTFDGKRLKVSWKSNKAGNIPTPLPMPMQPPSLPYMYPQVPYDPQYTQWS